jgi:exonuclease VII small subunit
MQDPKPPNFRCVSSDEVRITGQDAGVEVISAIPTLAPRNVRTNIAHGIFKEMAVYLDDHQQLKADEFAPEADCLLTGLSLTNFVADNWEALVKELIEVLKKSEEYQAPSLLSEEKAVKEAGDCVISCRNQRQCDSEDYENLKIEYNEIIAEARRIRQLMESKKVELDSSILAEKNAENILYESQQKLEASRVAAEGMNRPKFALENCIQEIVQKLKIYKPLP